MVIRGGAGAVLALLLGIAGCALPAPVAPGGPDAGPDLADTAVEGPSVDVGPDEGVPPADAPPDRVVDVAIDSGDAADGLDMIVPPPDVPFDLASCGAPGDVIFVDASRPDGTGSSDCPVRSITRALQLAEDAPTV